MAITTGDGGSSNTSGTAASVCAISPSDTVGVLNNFLTRIEKLEEIMMQIASANVLAGQLSELSSQIGWLYGVEYMGIEGWTQTSYGTLIPPAGFSLLGSGLTLSDGSTYQAVVMDENGVLQFGFGQTQSDGTFTPVVGELPDLWNEAAASTGLEAYADIGWHEDVFSSSIATGVTLSSATRGAGAGTISVTGLAVGKYWATGNATQYVTSGGTVGAVISGFLTVGITSVKTAVADTTGVVNSLGGAREAASIGTILDVTSTAQVVTLGWAAGIIGGSCTFQNPYEFAMQIIKLD
jgi:hypothetical protein